MNYIINEKNIDWEPHPEFNVKSKMLRTQGKDHAKGTIVITNVKKGDFIPEHVHENSDDYLFILKGQAKIKINEQVFSIQEGSQIFVPENTVHEIFDVSEDLLIYDVFVPPTV